MYLLLFYLQITWHELPADVLANGLSRLLGPSARLGRYYNQYSFCARYLGCYILRKFDVSKVLSVVHSPWRFRVFFFFASLRSNATVMNHNWPAFTLAVRSGDKNCYIRVRTRLSFLFCPCVFWGKGGGKWGGFRQHFFHMIFILPIFITRCYLGQTWN